MKDDSPCSETRSACASGSLGTLPLNAIRSFGLSRAAAPASQATEGMSPETRTVKEPRKRLAREEPGSRHLLIASPPSAGAPRAPARASSMVLLPKPRQRFLDLLPRVQFLHLIPCAVVRCHRHHPRCLSSLCRIRPTLPLLSAATQPTILTAKFRLIADWDFGVRALYCQSTQSKLVRQITFLSRLLKEASTVASVTFFGRYRSAAWLHAFYKTLPGELGGHNLRVRLKQHGNLP